MGSNEDGVQKSIILTTSSKLTGNLLWFSSVKQSIVVQSCFCNTLAMVRMTHNGNREKKATYSNTKDGRTKGQLHFAWGSQPFLLWVDTSSHLG